MHTEISTFFSQPLVSGVLRLCLEVADEFGDPVKRDFIHDEPVLSYRVQSAMLLARRRQHARPDAIVVCADTARFEISLCVSPQCFATRAAVPSCTGRCLNGSALVVPWPSLGDGQVCVIAPKTNLTTESLAHECQAVLNITRAEVAVCDGSLD